MLRSLSLCLAASLLVACTGGPETESSSQAVDSSAVVTSSSQVTISSAPISSAPIESSSSVAVSSSSASSQATVFVGNAVDGAKAYVDETCAGCHAKNDDGSFGVSKSGILYKFIVGQFDSPGYLAGNYEDSEAGLARYIHEVMPYNSEGDCEDQCAADIAAYLWQFSGLDIEEASLTCETDDPVYYGQRSLKVLTSFEYENSVRALFKAPIDDALLAVDGDSNVANMPNHSKVTVAYARMETYHQNASKIADWAAANQNAWPFSCADTQSAQCANAFVNDFAYLAFRRPLTAQERERYSQMITSSDSGLRWAFHSVLMSPQFLYRSELGVQVGIAKNDPNFLTGGDNGANSGAGSAEGYSFGAGAVTVNGADFATKGDGVALDGFGYNMYTNGTSSQQFNFPDPALVSITVKANDMDMMWPLMEVSVGQTMVAAEMVESYDQVTYKYLVTGVNGNQNLSIAFNNDGGREPYGTPGNDIDLHIGDVTVGAAVMADDSDPVVVEQGDPLLLADENAYVLDPFEYASALAYIYTGAGPDRELLDAAGNGDLNDSSKLSVQIDRMLDSALGREQVGRFAGVWLRTDRVTSKQRDAAVLTDQVKASMAQEVRELYSHFFYGNDPFSGFYKGDVAMLDKTLSDYYGVPGGGAQHMQFAPVDTSTSDERGGVLTTGAFMVVNAHDDRTSPIHRAVHVRQDMLCHNIPLPTAGALQQERDAAVARAQEREAEGDLSTWEFYNIQTNYLPGTDDPTTDACESCHAEIINPLAMMEDYDNMGRFRTAQKGLGPTGVEGVAIKTTGTLYGVTGVSNDELAGQRLPLSGGAKGLSKVLAGLDGVNSCLIEKSFRFSTATSINVDSQVSGENPLTVEQQDHFVCVAENLRSEMDANDGSPRAMLKALGMSDVIRFRK